MLHVSRRPSCDGTTRTGLIGGPSSGAPARGTTAGASPRSTRTPRRAGRSRRRAENPCRFFGR
jgi:hypothetical protein